MIIALLWHLAGIVFGIGIGINIGMHWQRRRSKKETYQRMAREYFDMPALDRTPRKPTPTPMPPVKHPHL